MAVKNTLSSSEHVKVKVAVYFLIGLIFSILGLIFGGLWLFFKVKTNRKPKTIALVVGVILPIVFGLISNTSFFRNWSKEFYSKIPEMKAVDTALSQQYPNANISLSAEHNTTYMTGQPPISASYFLVTYESDNLLTKSEMANVGGLVCKTLNSINKPYDYVSVNSKKSLKILVPLPIYTTYKLRASCMEWLGQDSPK